MKTLDLLAFCVVCSFPTSVLPFQTQTMPLTTESLCFLEHYPKKTCPDEAFESCIRKMPDTSYFFTTAEHLKFLHTEMQLCSESSLQDQCVHKEMHACTEKLDFLNAYEDFKVCGETGKVKTCLNEIREKCTYSDFRTEGMLELVLDRVNMTYSYCHLWYYWERRCSPQGIISCLDDFRIRGDLDCDSGLLGNACNCVHRTLVVCRTSAAQTLLNILSKALYNLCTYCEF